MQRLQAIKPHKYGTRHLVAGEEYEVPARHAVALVAARRARFVANKPPKVRPAVEAVADFVSREPAQPTLDELRLQATQLGINVDGRWGVHRLQQEIEARRG